MFCTQCGTANDAQAARCVKCGAVLAAAAPAATMATPAAAPAAAAVNVPNHLVLAIISTVCCSGCCGLPFGIAAIIFASQVNTKLATGDVAGAQAASSKAFMWAIIAIVLGVITSCIFGTLQAVPAIIAAAQNS